MYFVLPLWLIAGFADYLCHRVSHIETTTGAKESVIHLLMFAEIGAPLTAALFLQVNSAIILLMVAMFLIHEATALWDVSYAVSARDVSPVEQHIHSFLEMLPLMGILAVISLHWSQFQAIFGIGQEHPRFDLQLKSQALPVVYIVAIFTLIFLFELLPYVEELVRSLIRNKGKFVPARQKPPSESNRDRLTCGPTG